MAVALRNRNESIEMLFGAALRGVVFGPLNLRLPARVRAAGA